MVRLLFWLKRFGLSCCLLSVVSSCVRSGGELADYDETAVQAFVKPGISRHDVISHFGKPFAETTVADGSIVLIYRKGPKSFATHDLVRDKGGFSGFEVYCRNDIVIGWEPITSGPTQAPP